MLFLLLLSLAIATNVFHKELKQNGGLVSCKDKMLERKSLRLVKVRQLFVLKK